MRNLLDKLISIRNQLYAMVWQQWLMRAFALGLSVVVIMFSYFLLTGLSKTSTSDSTVFIGADLSVVPAVILLLLVLICGYQTWKPQTQLALIFYPLIGIIFWFGVGSPLWMYAIVALASVGSHTLWSMSAHTPAYSQISKELHTKRMFWFVAVLVVSVLLMVLSWLLYLLLGNLALQLSTVTAAYPALATIFWILGVSAVAIFVVAAVRNTVQGN